MSHTIDQHPLIGKVINSIYQSTDDKALIFAHTGGYESAVCDADCCSHTYINHIELPALGFPCLVCDVQELEMPDTGEEPKFQEVVSYYGLKIVTDKGELILDYRNESNGYYGGSLEFSNSRYFYGGVYGQQHPINDWKLVGGTELLPEQLTELLSILPST